MLWILVGGIDLVDYMDFIGIDSYFSGLCLEINQCSKPVWRILVSFA